MGVCSERHPALLLLRFFSRLEIELRKFTCLTLHDTICIQYNDRNYYIDIRELKPTTKNCTGVCIIDTDCFTDFEEPEDYHKYQAAVVNTLLLSIKTFCSLWSSFLDLKRINMGISLFRNPRSLLRLTSRLSCSIRETRRHQQTKVVSN